MQFYEGTADSRVLNGAGANTIKDMSLPENSESLPPVTPPRHGKAFVAWLIIVPLVALPTVMRYVRQSRAAEGANIVALELQGRVALGLAEVAGKGALTFQQLKSSLDTGPVAQRLRIVPLAGELAGPHEARQELHELRQRAAEHGVEFTESQRTVADLLDRLYVDYEKEDYAAQSLSVEDREVLRQRLGWFGELALNPANGPDPAARQALLSSAHQAAVAYFAVILGGLALGFIGFILLILFLVLLATGHLRRAIRTGETNGAIYAETFALWIALFYALGFAALFIPSAGQDLVVSGTGALLSLLALAWPIFRGIPWRQVRRDIGWTGGRHPVLEFLLGIPTYAAALPLLVLGVLLTLVLLMLQRKATGAGGPDYFGPSDAPTHPILNFAAGATWWEMAQVFLIASVIAPIVEETMFRGVLYRHLREATGKWGTALSILCSALVASFLFAAIHPQGLATIPALMALAMTFSLAREWRGSLLSAMVAHGINNAVVAALLFVVLRS